LLKDFYASIPPLIAIQSFTFDKAKAQGFSLADDGEYLGNVSFNIYGRGISTEESTEISTLLKEACFGSGSSTDLTVQGALDKVNEKMKIIGASTDSSDGKVALLSNLLLLYSLHSFGLKSSHPITDIARISISIIFHI